MTVTFFGHRDTSQEIAPVLKAEIVDLIENYCATYFYVGNNGNFDFMVRRLLKELSSIYKINYSVVLSYLPKKKSEYDDFSDTIYPEGLEKIPQRFAISYRNKWMINKSDIVVTYVTVEYGGAWQFKTMAQKQGKKIIELSKSTEK